MKSFLVKLSVFSLTLLLLLGLGLVLPDKSGVQGITHALEDKHRLLQKIPGPRIVLVGGSNLSFGINSKTIADSFHMPVINTGIVAGFGLKYIMDDISSDIQKDDIVVLVPEYNHFFGKTLYGNNALTQVWDQTHQFTGISARQLREQLQYMPQRSIGKTITWLRYYLLTARPPQQPLFNRYSFNEYGDVTVHWNMPRVLHKRETMGSVYHPATIEEITRFRDALLRKQARLFISYPGMERSSFTPLHPQIKKVATALQQNNFTMLGTPERYCFADSLFFNTPYHLTKQGLDWRTQLLIGDLQLQLQQ